MFSKMLTNNDYNYASLCTVLHLVMYFIYSDSGVGILVLPHTVLATFSLSIFTLFYV